MLGDAEVVAREAVARFPKSEWGFAQLGFVLLSRSRFEEPKSMLSRADWLHPGRAWIEGLLGIALAACGQTDEGIHYLSEVVRRPTIAPSLRAVFLNDLGVCLIRVGRNEDALRAFEDAVEAFPLRAAVANANELRAATKHTFDLLIPEVRDAPRWSEIQRESIAA